MDLSNSKLLEQDEGYSTHLGKNVDSLNRDTKGNPYQEVKQEVKREPGQLWETPSYVPKASTLQSRNSTIGNEPQRLHPQYLKLQKMTSQQSHGVEQPVEPMKHGHTEMKVLDLLNIMVPDVDKDTAVQLRALYSTFKKNKTAIDPLFRCLRDVVGNQKFSLAVSKLDQLQQRRRMATNQSVRSTSVGGQKKSTINITTVPNLERPNFVNGPSIVQGGPISHFQNNSSLPLNSVPWKGSVSKDQTVGPSSSVVHQESINQSFDLPQKPHCLVQQGVSDASVKQNNSNPSSSNDELGKQSSKMGLSTSTNYASIVSPSVATQLDSITMVNSSRPFGTIPGGANVSTTPKIPSVGQKKPLETLGSLQPPSSKKQKVCEIDIEQLIDVCEMDIKQLSDVTALSGVNLKKEEAQLFPTKPKKGRHVSEASRRVVHEEEERTIFQKIPLQRKLAEIMAKSGLKHINDDVERCLSLCVEERMRGLLSNIIRLSKQRLDDGKCRNRTFVTSDIRKQINEMNQKVKEEREKKQAEENNLKNVEENDTEKEENQSKQVKANKEEEDKRRTKAANVAARAAVGGNDAFLKWQLMAEARKKASSGPRSNSKTPYVQIGGKKVGMNQGFKKVVRSISAKDVIAELEKEPEMSKSMLLYRLYNRSCSDVRTQ